MIGFKQGGNGYKYRPQIGLIAKEPNFQKGSGLFSLLSKGFKMLAPVLKRGASVVKKVVTSKPMKNIGKNLSDSAVNLAGDALIDVIEGKNPSENFNSNLQKARKNISTTLRKEIKRKLNNQETILEPPPQKRGKRSGKKNRNRSRNIGTIL